MQKTESATKSSGMSGTKRKEKAESFRLWEHISEKIRQFTTGTLTFHEDQRTNHELLH